jgi:hypothetical protein
MILRAKLKDNKIRYVKEFSSYDDKKVSSAIINKVILWYEHELTNQFNSKDNKNKTKEQVVRNFVLSMGFLRIKDDDFLVPLNPAVFFNKKTAIDLLSRSIA